MLEHLARDSMEAHPLDDAETVMLGVGEHCVDTSRSQWPGWSPAAGIVATATLGLAAGVGRRGVQGTRMARAQLHSK